jgi:hypothetical protein
MDLREKEVGDMWKMRWVMILVVLAGLVSGCGKSTKQPSAASGGSAAVGANTGVAENGVKLEGPAAAAYEFLEALRTGSDEKALKLLSTVAREKTAALDRGITPSASDTARFAVGKVEYINDDGARVACTWTDNDSKGQPQTDEAVCAVRREPDGWKIAGIAFRVFPGEPLLQLNFEDPAEMRRKQEWARAEILRREEASGLQAQGGEKPEKPILR